jgi:cytoskeletal protein CcmA (bactofilin family)
MFGFGKKKESVFDLVDNNEGRGHSLIAAGVHIDGDIRFCGTLRIDGRVDGRVTVIDGKKGTLILSRGSVINGPVVTTDLLTDGTISGNVRVDGRLECRPHAIIRGEVQYQTIQILEGATIEGRCSQRVGAPAATPVMIADEPAAGVVSLKTATFLKKTV